MIRAPPTCSSTDTLFACPPLFLSLVRADPVLLLYPYMDSEDRRGDGVRRRAGGRGSRRGECRQSAGCGGHRAREPAFRAASAGGGVDACGLRRHRCVRGRSEEHTSELQSLMRISYAVFCLKKKKNTQTNT